MTVGAISPGLMGAPGGGLLVGASMALLPTAHRRGRAWFRASSRIVHPQGAPHENPHNTITLWPKLPQTERTPDNCRVVSPVLVNPPQKARIQDVFLCCSLRGAQFSSLILIPVSLPPHRQSISWFRWTETVKIFFGCVEIRGLISIRIRHAKTIFNVIADVFS